MIGIILAVRIDEDIYVGKFQDEEEVLTAFVSHCCEIRGRLMPRRQMRAENRHRKLLFGLGPNRGQGLTESPGYKVSECFTLFQGALLGLPKNLIINN